jgi:hypothetical protein
MRPALLLALSAALALPSIAHAADERAACVDAHAAGQDLRKAGKLGAAHERFLSCSRPACPAVLVKECTSFLAEVEAAQPSVLVAIRDRSGADLLGATVTIDGVAVTTDALARAIVLDPGAHDVRAESNGASATEHLLLREGEQRRSVTIVLDPRPPTALVQVGSPPVPPPRITRPMPWWVPVAWGAAAVGLGIGIGFGVDALGRDAAMQSCSGSCDPARVDAMYRSALVSDVGLGVGIGLAVIGTILYLVRPSVSSSAAALSSHTFPTW